ncbi:MAG: UBP-type zinc finger domain-containing protein, partial [Candidatus Sulfotelmatobacter sp.]
NFELQKEEYAMQTECKHLDEIKITKTSKHACEDCVKIGDTWIHLRLCLTCGHVGCCDSSKNRHARKHYHRVEHPLIRSIEPGERWVWCYADDIAVGELPA